MAFEGLSEKLNETFKRLRGKGRLTESDVKAGLREVRLVLLEADASGEALYRAAADILRDPRRQADMSRGMAELGIRDATQRLYDTVMSILR